MLFLLFFFLFFSGVLVSLQCQLITPAGAEPPIPKSGHTAVNIGQYIICKSPLQPLMWLFPPIPFSFHFMPYVHGSETHLHEAYIAMCSSLITTRHLILIILLSLTSPSLWRLGPNNRTMRRHPARISYYQERMESTTHSRTITHPSPLSFRM